MKARAISYGNLVLQYASKWCNVFFFVLPSISRISAEFPSCFLTSWFWEGLVTAILILHFALALCVSANLCRHSLQIYFYFIQLSRLWPSRPCPSAISFITQRFMWHLFLLVTCTQAKRFLRNLPLIAVPITFRTISFAMRLGHLMAEYHLMMGRHSQSSLQWDEL